jgi:tetratricopeptide (TPR) repeat protein
MALFLRKPMRVARLTKSNRRNWSSPRVEVASFLLGLALVTCRGGCAQDRAESPAGHIGSTNTPEAHLGAGYEELKSNRFEAAAREFRAALALNPKLVLQAEFPLAVSLFELHQTEDARREFEAVRRAAGDHPNIEYYLGRLDLTEGKLDDAILEFNRAAANPPFPDTAYYLGYAYLKRQDVKLAEEWLRKAAEAAPRDPAVQYQLGLLYSKTGRKQEAQEAYSKSEQLRRRDAEVDKLRLECKQRLDQGPLDTARPVCDQLFDPDDAEKLTMLGTIYGEHGFYAEALEPLRRAAELSPSSPQMQYNLAFDYFRLKQYAEARKPLAKAVARWPDLYPLNALLGVVLYNLSEELPAYEALHHAYELNPRDSGTADILYQVTLSLAQKNLTSKQYVASLRYLSEATRLRPQEPEPHRLLAQIYDVTGRQAEAAEERRQLERLASAGGAHPN